ncbi:MAG: PDZ domain-containing protein [Nitrospira sp.]
MRLKAAALASCLVMSVCTIPSWADQAGSQVPSQYGHGKETKLPNGVIGAVIQVGAERIGEPAALYVMKVRQDGPAQQAGLRHGDEIVSVNGTSVSGKSYEEIVSMIRGEVGTSVELEIRGTRELSITRVPNDTTTPRRSGDPG